MKRRMGAGSGMAFALLMASMPAWASSNYLAVLPSLSRAQAGSSEILREIVDPATGNRWLLERDAGHPGGPARLVPAGKIWDAMAGRSGAPSKIAPGAPVIRAGDAILLSAHTAVMDAQLEAVALAPAPAGASFRARLKIGGRIVEAVALGPGRAEWAQEDRVQP